MIFRWFVFACGPTRATCSQADDGRATIDVLPVDARTLDDLFRRAVEAIDTGDLPALDRLLADQRGSRVVNGHFAAAERILQRGGTVTLASALCLGRFAFILAEGRRVMST